MPNTYTKNDGRMNERQEVMRTTSNTYGHNSNRHLDRKDCKEGERVKETKTKKKKKNGKLKKKTQENHASPAQNQLSMTFLLVSFFFD